MIITNTRTSTIIAIIGGERVEIKYNQSANIPEKDAELLLKLFPALKAETVIEAEPAPIVEAKEEEPKAEPKVKRNGKGKKSGK